MITIPFDLPRLARYAAAACIALAVSACGGGDGSSTPAAGSGGSGGSAETVTLSGTAATGAPVKGGTVVAINANGNTVEAKTKDNGDYELTIGSAPPYLLKITTTASGTLYSFASAGGRANLTPLTTLALHDANGKKPLAALFEGWKSTRLAADAVTAAAKRVNANFQASYTAQGVDYKTFDFFGSAFSANGKGFDAVLDGISVSLSCSTNSCSETIKVGDTVYTYNFTIDTTGISFTSGGGSSGGATSTIPAGSTWDLTLSGTASGQSINQTIQNIELAAVPTSVDGAQSAVAQFGGQGGTVTTPDMTIKYNLGSSSYQGCGSCGVGSTIVMKVKGSITVSGTVNGFPVNQSSDFDYTYTYKRVK
ncbi:hypothetical protein PIGHUM_00192 [Pigmentiphaga humi]|uniref:Carboxypeptidase regulatory-like domain-containing protein n=1 Tax=Pigmentiphaga humi TaxID=2478468 RepID=A0A3P4AWP8_9BURK|nr:hypothetical protein [Pigmentiphaga humi]VCU68142.1 hypothetical protein PIGHUM_00192 [Pigmentiphaga humi]